MKFGRLLKTTSVDLPEMEALFSAYKTLKKHVKRLPFKEQLGQSGTLENLTEEENNFCKALSDTLHQLNDMFLAKEETSVIRVERLEHDLAAPSTPEQLNNLHKQFVDFHGEVLLLVHWSILAYTATVKILKKHHKRTGLLVKAPQLGNLLSQPFCSTELMTSIAHRVEEDIQRLAERMGVSGQRSSEPTEQQQQQRHPARLVAAAVSADLPQLSNGGLDMQLLQQLADSGSLTTPSDSSMCHEEDTAHTSSKRTYHHHHQQQQHLHECSQQAHLQDGGAASEVQSISKRRRTAAAAAAAAAAPVDSVSQAATGGACRAGAGVAAVDQVDSATGSQQQQAGQQAQAPVPADRQADVVAAAALQPRLPASQQPWLPASNFVRQHRCSSTGCTADHEQQQQQEQQVQEPDLEPTISMSGCSTCGRQCSIMRQTQVALTTWKHLQSTASTPSTVVPNYQLLHRSNTTLTESSAA